MSHEGNPNLNGQKSSLKYHSTVSTTELKARAFGVGFVNPLDKYKKLYIDDIPIMITNQNEILCIPKENETTHWGITGQTGTCKTILINSTLSWDFHHTKRVCINLNDIQSDSFEWSMPTNSFLDILDKLNIKPCPTPIIYVFPSTDSLQIDKKQRKFPFIKMSIPLEEVIRNIEDYYPLDKSKVYVGNLIDDLIECSSISEIRSIIDENIPEKHMQMKFKIMNIFEAIFNNNMLNVSVPEAPAYLGWTDGKDTYKNFTIQTLMRAGFVPSIQTADLANQDYFSAYMAFIVKELYRNQNEDPYFKEKIVSLFVDEIDKLWKGDNGKLIIKALCFIGTNGRMARIGMRWSTQHYELVPEKIRNNTKYLFISRKSDAKEVKEIEKDFGMPKSMQDDILKLTTDKKKGLFEMVAVTTEEFVLYDVITGKKRRTSQPQRGFLIPPMARHRVPGVEI
jgi:hypothetical protein